MYKIPSTGMSQVKCLFNYITVLERINNVYKTIKQQRFWEATKWTINGILNLVNWIKVRHFLILFTQLCNIKNVGILKRKYIGRVHVSAHADRRIFSVILVTCLFSTSWSTFKAAHWQLGTSVQPIVWVSSRPWIQYSNPNIHTPKNAGLIKIVLSTKLKHKQ